MQDAHPERNTMDIFSLAWPGMCAELGLPPSEAPTEAYQASVLDWEPFPDSVAALAYLKQHYVMFPITTGALACLLHGRCQRTMPGAPWIACTPAGASVLHVMKQGGTPRLACP